MAITQALNQIRYQLDDSEFLQIGDINALNQLTDEKFKLSKFNKISEIWGTLGWLNNQSIEGQGEVTFSKDGNYTHRGITKEIASILIDQNIEVKSPKDIRERFISLTNLKLSNAPKVVNKQSELMMRFSLFLEKNEGALVYLQYSRSNNYNALDSYIQLITPNKTDETGSQNRFKLDYEFPFLQNNEALVENGSLVLKKDLKGIETILKVLTFKRSEEDFGNYINSAVKKINSSQSNLVHDGLHLLGKKKYKLLKFNPSSTNEIGGNFESIVPGSASSKIDPTKKTLLLLHGTFSTTVKSFKEFTDQQDQFNDNSFLQHLISKGIYEQVLAFDHPTASHSPQDNVKELISRLENVNFGENLIDVITTSRGALVAEVLSGFEPAINKLMLNKVMMFSAANGCDLLRTAKNLDQVLSVAKKFASGSAWKYILAIAQFSVDKIRTQPGLQAMFPDSKELKGILDTRPNNVVRFRGMVGDWIPELEPKRFLRTIYRGIDGLLWLSFRDKHDWVIGCSEQRKKLTDSNAKSDGNLEYFSTHGKYFVKNHARLTHNRRLFIFDEIIEYFKT